MKKRFIAGASCPKCQTQDSLKWWMENNIEIVGVQNVALRNNVNLNLWKKMNNMRHKI